MYQIESNIPAPNRSPLSATLKALEVSQSFVIPNGSYKYGSMAATILRIGKELSRKFTLRKLENGDFRIWRIE